MKNQKKSVATFLVIAFAVAMVINSTSALARVIPWTITKCTSDSEDSRCQPGVKKIATINVPDVNGYPVRVDATLTSGVKVVVMQTNKTYGDLRVTFVFNNIGTFPAKFERRKRDGGWEVIDGRPSDYQGQWVDAQIANLQKQDSDFDFTGSR